MPDLLSAGRRHPGPAAAALIPLLAWGCPAIAADPVERAAIALERNATDDDLEIRFELSSGPEGFATLRMTAPDGRPVVELNAADSRLGIRHVTLESPEPAKGTGVLQAFPAGVYGVTGRTVAGAELEGQATLSHELPAASAILSPEPDQRGVRMNGVVLRWRAVPGIAGFLVVIEHERSGHEIRARLPASTTSMSIPDGFLVGGRTYKVAVGTLARDGNRTFVESEFSTAR